MIELQCPTCLKTFERRGAKRGKHPDCNECRDLKEAKRCRPWDFKEDK